MLPAFEDGDLVLIPDRSVSPAGARILKDARSKRWPNPNVYTFPQLARRILTVCEQRDQKLYRPRKKLNPLEILGALKNVFANPDQKPDLKKFWADFENAQELFKVGLQDDEILELTQAIQQARSQDPELTPWARTLLTVLTTRRLQSQQNALFNEWEELRLLCSLSLRPTPLQSLVEGLMPIQRIVWMETCQLWPLEQKLIEILTHWGIPCSSLAPKKIPRQVPHSDHNTATALETEPTDLKTILPTKISYAELQEQHAQCTLHWARPEGLPGRRELLSYLPSHVPLDLEIPPQVPLTPQQKTWILAADFLDKQSPADHPYKNLAAALTLADLSLDNLLRESTLPLLEQTKWKEIFQDSPNPVSQALYFLEAWDFWKDPKPDTTTHRSDLLQNQAGGVPALSLGDLFYSPSQWTVIAGHTEDLLAWLDPEHSIHIKAKPFHSTLRSLMLSWGYRIPNPSEEVILQRNWIAHSQKKLRWLNLYDNSYQPNLSPVWIEPNSAPAIKTYLSPSAIEKFISCPLQFKLNRDLGLRPQEADDPDKPSAEIGSWIHASLEHALTHRDPSFPKLTLHSWKKILEATLEGFFPQSRFSQSSKNLLVAQASKIAHSLELHQALFERPLEACVSNIQRISESRLSFNDVPCWNSSWTLRLDRLDVFENGRFGLIWDYKTGAPKSAKRFETLLKNAELQWLLYAKLFEQLDPQHKNELGLAPDFCLVGGGYLYPLQPEKSAFFSLTHQGKDLLESLQTQNAALAKTSLLNLNPEDLTRLDHYMAEVVSHALSGPYPARPLKPKHCLQCSVQPICGRPLFLVEGLAEAEDEADT